MSKIIKIPESKYVKKGKNCWCLHEKAILARICCQHHPKSDKFQYEMITIKITSNGILPDNVVCLDSFSGGCPNTNCVLHVSDVF